MADWAAIYDRAEDMELERLRRRAERRKAQQQSQQTSSRATTGTTEAQAESDDDAFCMRPIKEYESNPDRNEPFTLEECLQETTAE